MLIGEKEKPTSFHTLLNSPSNHRSFTLSGHLPFVILNEVKDLEILRLRLRMTEYVMDHLYLLKPDLGKLRLIRWRPFSWRHLTLPTILPGLLEPNSGTREQAVSP